MFVLNILSHEKLANLIDCIYTKSTNKKNKEPIS